ncbi:MAG: septum site-determining protein MinC [Deltaproteobacteria bacterium]|nr:septum site-determining protein MinC [Deltaproteobacteria bacterium]
MAYEKSDKKPEENDIPVRLKGVGDSLWVTFDPGRSPDVLKVALAKPFERLGYLAVNARVILDPCGREVAESLVKILENFLRQEFQVGQVSLPPSPRPDKAKIEKREQDTKSGWGNADGDTVIISGRVRSGQKVEAKKHLVILGDLNPGAEAISGGDIIVMGNLLGTALAGQPDNEQAVIIALDFRPTQVQIGGFVAAGVPSTPGIHPEIARVEDNCVIVDDYVKASPFKRLAWPKIR